MADSTKACSASVAGPGLCTNGFRQSASCHGMGFSCPCCGKEGNDVPQCLQEDVPPAVFPRWFNDAGRPRFAQAALPAQGHDKGGEDA